LTDTFECSFTKQERGESVLIAQAKATVNSWAAKIAINQNNSLACPSYGYSEVGSSCGFTVTWPRAGDLHRANRPVDGKELHGSTKTPVCLSRV
jgi:hypothetical protein